jgi:hypothetical protein
MIVFALIHSPLTDPLVWEPVRAVLIARGFSVIVPNLTDEDRPPYWSQHADSAARAIADLPAHARIILTAHSGAGPLLAVIGQRMKRLAAVYLFVDAGLPAANQSRLDLIHAEDAELGRVLSDALSAGARFPEWTDDDLRALIPDDVLRARVVATLRPRRLDYFTEAIPAVDAWPDAPCGYVQFSTAYAQPAAEAAARGWPVRRLDGGHFHLLTDPVATADALIGLVQS